MIPTFLIDLPVLMLFGVLFSVFAGKETRGLCVFKSSYFWHGLIFSTIFNIAVVYAIIRFPDWMWMYFLQESRNTLFELVYLFIFLYYFPYLLGFILGCSFLEMGKMAWMAFVLFLVGWEGWLIAHLFERYSVVGTRDEFLNGTAVSLFSPQNPIGPVMNASVGLMIVYYGVVWWRHRKKRGRNPVSQPPLADSKRR